MSKTNSIKFPNMIDVSSNKVGLYTDNESVVNRTRLLFLSDPTSLYNNPTFGVGLKRYLFQYNNQNTVAMIKDRMVEQLREHEPCVDPDKTSFADGLIFSEEDSNFKAPEYNHLKMTVGLRTIYNEELEVEFNNETTTDPNAIA